MYKGEVIELDLINQGTNIVCCKNDTDHTASNVDKFIKES